MSSFKQHVCLQLWRQSCLLCLSLNLRAPLLLRSIAAAVRALALLPVLFGAGDSGPARHRPGTDLPLVLVSCSYSILSCMSTEGSALESRPSIVPIPPAVRLTRMHTIISLGSLCDECVFSLCAPLSQILHPCKLSVRQQAVWTWIATLAACVGNTPLRPW